MYAIVHNIVVNVLEWWDRFTHRAPRTRFEEAIFDTIRYIIYRFTHLNRPEELPHGSA